MNFLEKIEKIDSLYKESEAAIQGPADFKKIIAPFRFSIEEMEEHLLYPDNLPYGRKVAFRSERIEVIVMNWKPGKSSNIHDHGNSFGCVYAVSGNAANVLYDEHIKYIDSLPLTSNNIAEVPKGIYHAIENNTDAYAVSLHFYAPPLKDMKVIDRENPEHTFLAKPDVGAWNHAGE